MTTIHDEMKAFGQTDEALVEPTTSTDHDANETCQGCGGLFDPDDVMITGVGPVCFNCLMFCANKVLG